MVAACLIAVGPWGFGLGFLPGPLLLRLNRWKSRLYASVMILPTVTFGASDLVPDFKAGCWSRIRFGSWHICIRYGQRWARNWRFSRWQSRRKPGRRGNDRGQGIGRDGYDRDWYIGGFGVQTPG